MNKTRQYLNDKVKTFGNKLYNGLGDVLTTDIKKPLIYSGLCATLAFGCSSPKKIGYTFKYNNKVMKISKQEGVIDYLVKETNKPTIKVRVGPDGKILSENCTYKQFLEDKTFEPLRRVLGAYGNFNVLKRKNYVKNPKKTIVKKVKKPKKEQPVKKVEEPKKGLKLFD